MSGILLHEQGRAACRQPSLTSRVVGRRYNDFGWKPGGRWRGETLERETRPMIPSTAAAACADTDPTYTTTS
ncbi:hypothetical protein GALMADRAFT_260312 [Galerina marginata CBS 339.88]|uniref:Uncharacterized protein n=1 Tax=Galerina marginata (strain CBS 339.88) TaxID=685588 RepID=A0A067S2U7_GALM3|nr:hypothetical protein GALMADRAFT_260312 [Galerina marginata CBS 339.88]